MIERIGFGTAQVDPGSLRIKMTRGAHCRLGRHC